MTTPAPRNRPDRVLQAAKGWISRLDRRYFTAQPSTGCGCPLPGLNGNIADDGELTDMTDQGTDMRSNMNSRLALAAATFALAVTAGLVGGTAPSQASGNLQWCAQNVTYNLSGDCSYASFAQCQATISGIGGDCIQNPRLAYDPSYAEPRGSRAQNRRWQNGR